MNRLSLGVPVLVLASVFAPGCKKGGDLPPEADYIVRSLDLKLVGATVVVQGQRGVFQKNPWNAQTDVAAVTLKLPRTGPSAVGDLKVEIQTPCGVKLLPLKGDLDEAKEKELRGYSGPIGVMTTLQGDVPARTDVWVDAGQQKVAVGQATLTPREGVAAVYDIACQASSPVTIDGAEVGKVDAAATKDKSLFVTAKKAVCYHRELAGYGSGAGAGPVILKGAQVYVMENSRIDYFLKKAPDSVQVGAKGGTTYKVELYETPCP